MTVRNKYLLVCGVAALYLITLVLLVSFESRYPDANIKNFQDAVWYSFVTMTTVGYGDYFPKSTGGKIIGLVFIFGSLGLIGFLIGKIADTLSTIKERKKMGLDGTDFTHHIVIIGWNGLSRMMARQVFAAGKKIAVITNDRNDIDLIHELFPGNRVFVLLADLQDTDSWYKANLEQSTAVFINLRQDTDKLVCVLNLKKRFPDLNYVVTLDNENLKDTFHSAGVRFAISKDSMASKMLASYTFEPDVAEYNEDLLSSAESEEDMDIKQYRVLDTNPYVDWKYFDFFIEMKRRLNAIVIGLVKTGDGQRKLLKNPPDDTLIAPGDYIIVIVNKSASQKASQTFGVEEGY